MPKRIKHSGKLSDVNQLAHRLVQVSTTESEDNPSPSTAISDYMATIGRKGGKIGGKRRLDTLTDKQRKKIATNAAKARWANKQKAR